MLEKKSNIPIIKVILILFTTSIIFISFIFFFFNTQSLNVDNKKINTQIVLKKILNPGCFSNEYATIEEVKFSEENLNICFKNFNEDIYFNVVLRNFDTKNLESNYLYLNNKGVEDPEKEFKDKGSLCSIYSVKSSLYCSTHKIPILYVNDKNEKLNKILEINIISS